MGNSHDFEERPDAEWAEEIEWPPSDADDEDSDDVDSSDEAILAEMLALKGTDAARELFDLLRVPACGSPEPSVEQFIDKVNALYAASALTADERYYMIHETIEPKCLDRGELRSARYVAVREAVDAIEAAAWAREDFGEYQLDSEFRRLNNEWHVLVEAQEADWWADLGEPELADQLRNDRKAFLRHMLAGEKSLFGSAPEHFDWADHPGS